MKLWTAMDPIEETVDPVHRFFYRKIIQLIPKIVRALDFYKNTMNFSKIVF
jgi:hypothetical protein